MSSSSNNDDDEGFLVSVCLVVTIQLLRVSMELVQVASKVQRRESERLDNKNNNNKRKKPHSTSSYGATDDRDQKKNGDDDKEDIDDETMPFLLGQGAAAVLEDEESARDKRLRVFLFVTLWSLLAVALAVIGFLLPTCFTRIGVLLSALAIAIDVWLLVRDINKERYGSGQRWLQWIAHLMLWCTYAVPMTLSCFPSTNNKSDYAVLGIVTCGVLLSSLDGYLSTRLPQVKRRISEAILGPDGQAKPQLSKGAFLKLLQPYFWPNATDTSAFLNRARAILTWVCVVTSKAASLSAPLFLGWATTALAHEQYRLCIRNTILYALITLVGSTLNEFRGLVYLKVAQAAFVQLAEVAFGHLHNLSLDWHLRKKMGETLRAMDRGIAACDTLMKYLFLYLVPALAEALVVCIIFATWFQYLPMALAVFFFVFLYVVWTILVTLWRKKFRKALTKSDNDYHDIFTDSMMNFETVKNFTAEKFEQARFVKAVERYQSGSVNVQASLSFLNISQQIILQSCLATALSLAAVAIAKRGDCCRDTAGCQSVISDCCQDVAFDLCPGMQVGDFVAVLTYTLNLFRPLNFLGSVYNAIVMAIVDLTSMSELLAENPDVVDAPDAMDLPPTTTDDIAIEFDNVSFKYPTQSENKGLKGLNIKMKRGTTTAIVGPTGAGKTTVSRLLFRFYDVLGGAVKVNGVDVRSLKQSSLRQAIGVVPQAACMFNDTIRYNIAYGKPNATQQEIEQAAKDAQLLTFIEQLQDGWETMVGDRGLKLSGGEKQRAAIARCLLKDPPFVLLDEATSALDTVTENSVQEALDRLGSQRTVLVIAHRLGTIRHADNIVVLKDGVAAEQGTHDELLQKRNGIYAELWNMQLHSTAES